MMSRAAAILTFLLALSVAACGGPGGSVTLQPGGYHVMLTGLVSELKTGTFVALVLTFEHAGVVKVTAEVRAS